MIPSALRLELEHITGPLRDAAQVGGGCISNASRLEADKGTFFLKHASGEAGATFEAEAAGLGALSEAAADSGLCVPTVLHARNAAELPGVLLMEWISPGSARAGYWERFGAALASLHRRPAPRGDAAAPYGFASDNFIGRLPQKNGWRQSWPELFAELRLSPQLQRARRSGHWRSEWNGLSDALLRRLDTLLPRLPHPSMLHGDLWSGNQLPDSEGRPWLVDPAAYVGDREADLAMTELFGGFGAAFYSGYRAQWPLEPEYETRRDLYNLYHLLNHLNHFGASYAPQVDRVLSRFGR